MAVWSLEHRPKAELHVHFEGSLDVDILRRLAERKGLAPPEDDPFVFNDFDEFMAVFVSLRPFIAEEADFRLAAYEFGLALDRQGIVYAESVFMPFVHVVRGLDYAGLVEELAAGLEQAEAETGVVIRLLAAIPRYLGPEAAEATLGWLAAHPNPRVIGLDLAGPETPESIVPFEPYFERAREMGLFTVAHAGEFGSAENVWLTLERLKPARIGHGLAAASDERLMDHLVEADIALEISPSSNLKLGAVASLAEHPVRRLFDAGVPVTINTDDPAFFKTDLNRELGLLASELVFSPQEIDRLIENGFRYSFLNPAAKALWLDEVKAGSSAP